jgi:Lipoprotein LpqB beta-propeller domain/Sporulation and spore germination
MSWTRHRLAAIFIVLASLFGAGGCVSVPISGPIEKVEGQQPPCQNCVNVEVKPPLPGDKPKQIVEGFLRANNNYQPNYSVARQFLTPMAAETWSPETGVWIYRGAPSETADGVTLGGRVVGALDADRSYSARDQKLVFNFGLVKNEKGEWRIGHAPGGLMVEEYSFKSFYQGYDLYFVGNKSSLVPDPIYLPALNNPANVASALMKALLKGPTDWLKPAVDSAIPPNTTLSVDSVTITDGIAEVPLSDSVLDLPDAQRSLLAAQIVYTLKQVGGVKGVVIRVNQQPFRVPGADPNSQVISVDAIPPDMDPTSPVAGDQLYAVRQQAVKQVSASSNPPAFGDLPGPLGGGLYKIDALAVSVNNTDFAVTTDGRTALRRALITTGEQRQIALPRDVSELLRPQFSRYGEIWAIGKQGGQQRMWWIPPGKTKPFAIASPVLQTNDVTAFKISPDGTRMALIRHPETGNDELGLARIIRSDNKIMVDRWRPLDTTQSNMLQIEKITDVAWLDPTQLVVLGAGNPSSALAAYRVVEDASQITSEAGPENSNAVGIAVLPRTQTAIIIGQKGQTWKDDGNQWQPFVDNVSTVAYPG